MNAKKIALLMFLATASGNLMAIEVTAEGHAPVDVINKVEGPNLAEKTDTTEEEEAPSTASSYIYNAPGRAYQAIAGGDGQIMTNSAKAIGDAAQGAYGFVDDKLSSAYNFVGGKLSEATGYNSSATLDASNGTQSGGWNFSNYGQRADNATGNRISAATGSLSSAGRNALATASSYAGTAGQGLMSAGRTVFDAPGNAIGPRIGAKNGQIISGDTGNSLRTAARAVDQAIYSGTAAVGSGISSVASRAYNALPNRPSFSKSSAATDQSAPTTDANAGTKAPTANSWWRRPGSKTQAPVVAEGQPIATNGAATVDAGNQVGFGARVYNAVGSGLRSAYNALPTLRSATAATVEANPVLGSDAEVTDSGAASGANPVPLSGTEMLPGAENQDNLNEINQS